MADEAIAAVCTKAAGASKTAGADVAVAVYPGASEDFDEGNRDSGGARMPRLSPRCAARSMRCSTPCSANSRGMLCCAEPSRRWPRALIGTEAGRRFPLVPCDLSWAGALPGFGRSASPTGPSMKKYHDMPAAIGNTPLIRLNRVSELTGCEIWGKAEFLNPGQSVKDRAALYIIKDAVNRAACSVRAAPSSRARRATRASALRWSPTRWASNR